ncbi:MAG: hypothetical protein JWP87_4520 [Labilithrix sp.]|nr:hypothetical protein [Labilithrix sp.]
MITFGSGMSAAATATGAAREAATQALATLHRQTPKLAIVFASAGYADVAEAARAVRSVVGDAQIVGGTSGACVFAGDRVASRGVSVVLLAGDSLDVESRTAQLGSPMFVETVPAAEKVARAADRAAERGLDHFACLVFAPGLSGDGEALVAAVRKGAGARAQLAGALTGDDMTFDRARVFFGDELRDDCVVITGLFTTTPIGIAARHGRAAVGPVRTVTRADGIHLCELDGRAALEVWVEDARRAGATPPLDKKDLAIYLANHFGLGVAHEREQATNDRRELVARAPFSIRADGAIELSASIPDGTHVRVLHASRADLLRASSEAATSAVERAGGRVSGALVLACTGRLMALGDAFAEEPSGIRRALGAPIGGACVFGEIARNVRDTDAFFNTTAVVVAFAA